MKIFQKKEKKRGEKLFTTGQKEEPRLLEKKVSKDSILGC